MADKIAIIKPIKLKEYDVKQSKYAIVPKLPTRSIILGPSQAGKGILLQNFILDIYKNLFSRIYIFSPSINVDYQTWKPVKKYMTDEMGLKEDDEHQYLYEQFDVEALSKILTDQRKLIEYQKQHPKTKRLFQILIVFDDVADDPKICRYNTLLNSCFIKGRHLSDKHHSFNTKIYSTKSYNTCQCLPPLRFPFKKFQRFTNLFGRGLRLG